MPKRKKLPKIPDYIGIPANENKLMVQKSNPLQSLSETGMSLVEFKILDAYLSRIDSRNPDKRFVRFEKGELEKILGVSRILKNDLDSRLDGLFKTVTIRDKHKNRGFTKIGLFERAEAKQDDDGLWQVDLICTPSAMEYIFNIEVMGYLPYMLKNIIELTSRYSYVLYLYLESRRKGKQSNSWTIPLDELKEMLRCTADTYKQYYRFNELVLKKCYKELLEKTDLRFTYEPVKGKGRKVTAIKFTVERIFEEVISENKPIDSQMTFEDVRLLADHNEQTQQEQDNSGESVEIKYGSSLADLLGGVSCDNEFAPEQIRVLQDLVIQVVDRNSCDKNSYELQCCDYLTRKIHMMNAYDKEKQRYGDRIGNRFKYLCSMIQQDIDKEE
ncbi:MAG: replication initiation protein [Clostridia bacterium]|nr:replication initiation protein [Clostridia bacterium]